LVLRQNALQYLKGCVRGFSSERPIENSAFFYPVVENDEYARIPFLRGYVLLTETPPISWYFGPFLVRSHVSEYQGLFLFSHSITAPDSHAPF
jgi:hypothetical protein